MTTYILNATSQWADTGIDIVANQPLLISATGTIGPWASANIGPDGSPTLKWASSDVSNEYFCKLVGIIIVTGSIPFGIGSGLGIIPQAGRLHLEVNDGVSFADNHGQLTVEVTQGATAIDKLIEHLQSRYGVTAYKNGLHTNDPKYQHRKAWTFQELSEVLLGLQFIVRGLYALKYPTQDQNQVPDGVMQSLFRNVMGPIQIRRVKNQYTANSAACDGTADAACTDVGNQFIAFYRNLVSPLQYTLTHELGHWFNNRSAMSGGMSLFSHMESASVNDSNGATVFGVSGNDWVRGKRGWGSGPASTYADDGSLITLNISNFQQNSYTVLDIDPSVDALERFKERDEATADMFLNCMYAVATNREKGFLNKQWLDAQCQTASGCADASNPGNARYDWMQQKMAEIFLQHPTWI